MADEVKTLEDLQVEFQQSLWKNADWTDKVIGMLAENEISKDDKQKIYPRVRGLRRIGSFIAKASMECDVIGCTELYAACKATARINGFVAATAMAEATPANVNNDMIAKHLLATAESRAEGRCWTKVLVLNCLTAEEMSLGFNQDKPAAKEVTREIDDEESGNISDVQRKTINNKSKKLDVNSLKIGEIICNKENLDVKSSIVDGVMKKALASKVLEVLGQMERGEVALSDKTKGFVKL